MKSTYLVLCALLLPALTSLSAQNSYLTVTAVGSNYAVSAESRNANPGDQLLIYQYGGAIVDSVGTSTGEVSALRGAGHFALTTLDRVAGDTLYFSQAITAGFQPGYTQIVTDRPQNLRTVADRSAPPFDGRVGGILFLSATERLTLTGTLTADGTGFRGGKGIQVPGSCNFLTLANALTYPSGNFRGSSRGEGIAADPPSRALGRAPLANGGGGGNDHNTGGGGGANVAAGGIGATNIVNSAFLCRGQFPGFGGEGLPADGDRIYFGGGGGAGHANNTAAADGGRGGGLIVLWAPEVVFDGGAVVHGRGAGASTVSGDGAGGGGAGGSLLIHSTTVSGSPEITLTGGSGGDTENLPDRCFGPGGGGGGGRVLVAGNQDNFAPVTDLSGGAPGRRLGSGICGPTESIGSPGEEGSRQVFEDTRPVSNFALSATELCTSEILTLSDNSRGADAVFYRFSPSASGIDLSTTADGLSISFGPGVEGTFTVTQLLVVGMDTLTGQGALFRVVGLPTADTLLIRESGDSITLEVVGARNFDEILFMPGDGTTVATGATTLGYRYPEAGTYRPSVRLVSDRCGDATLLGQTVTAEERVRAIILEKDPSGCAPLTIDPLDFSRGNYTGRRWDFPGGTPASSTDEHPTVTYPKPGRYQATLTLTGTDGGADTTARMTVNVFDTPTANFEYTSAGTQVTFRNLSDADAVSDWSFGDGASSSERDPTHVYAGADTFTVTLIARGSYCSDTISVVVDLENTTSVSDLQQLGITVYPNPTAGRIFITGPASVVGIYDATGRKLPAIGSVVDLSGYPRGTYLLRIRVQGKSYTVPILRQ